LLPVASWDFVSRGATIMMDLAQTKRRRRQYVLLGMVLLFAGVVGSVMGLLKHHYVMKVAQGPIAKLVTALWDVPSVSWLWYHASLNSSYPSGDGWSVYIILCFGLMLVGGVIWGLAGRLSKTIKESAQLAHVERLKNERLGYTHPPGSRITQITDSTIQGNFIGGDLEPHAQVSYTHNELPTIKAHINYMLTHMDELPLRSL